MRKFLFLSLIFSVFISASAIAQGSASGPAVKPAAPPQQPTEEQFATMLQQAKEKQTAPMVEKTGLTVAQVHRIIEINFEIRKEASVTLQGLSDEERSAKLAEFKATKERKYSEIPLTADQLKAVYAYYEEMSKNAPKREIKNN